MTTEVLGVQINTLEKNVLIQKLQDIFRAKKKIFIVTPYSEMLVAAQKDESFRHILNSADIALADGIGVLWAAHYQTRIRDHESGIMKFFVLLATLIKIVFEPSAIRNPILEKISGSEFVWDLARIAEKENKSVFLLGGFDDTPEKTAAVFKKKFPNLRIAGTYAGSPQEEGIVQKINASSAHFLFVAFGPVRQEKWIYENLKNLNIELAIGLGGTFDYITGKHPQAPKILRFTGLEWLWRLITQPWRIKRIFKGIFGLIWYTYKSALTVSQKH